MDGGNVKRPKLTLMKANWDEFISVAKIVKFSSYCILQYFELSIYDFIIHLTNILRKDYIYDYTSSTSIVFIPAAYARCSSEYSHYSNLMQIIPRINIIQPPLSTSINAARCCLYCVCARTWVFAAYIRESLNNTQHNDWMIVL